MADAEKKMRCIIQMVNPKRKGRNFEVEIFKIFRDLHIFKEVKLTLGSGSSDELADINIRFYNDVSLFIECKKGNKSYISEPNIKRWLENLEEKAIEKELKNYKCLLVVNESFRHKYIVYRTDIGIIARILLDDFFALLIKNDINIFSIVYKGMRE